MIIIVYKQEVNVTLRITLPREQEGDHQKPPKWAHHKQRPPGWCEQSILTLLKPSLPKIPIKVTFITTGFNLLKVPVAL